MNECVPLQLDRLKEKFLFRAFFLRLPCLAFLPSDYFHPLLPRSLFHRPQSRSTARSRRRALRCYRLAALTSGHLQTKGNGMEERNANVISSAIGDFGRWQAAISVLVSLLKLPIAWFQLSIVFLAPLQDFWCEAPSPDVSLGDWRNETLNNCNANCSRYEFDTSVFKRTITSEWALVCEKSQLSNVVQMSFMFGALVGNVIFGIASDRFGRKTPLMTAIAIQAFSSFALSFVPWFWAFLLLRFILAISTGGTMITSFVLCVETIGGKWRTSIPILYQIPFGLANSIMAVMAYFLRDWRQLTLAMSTISMLFLSYWWLIPESPRWLLAVGEEEKAAKILEKAAKKNRLNPKEIATILSSRASPILNGTKPQERGPPPFLGLFKTRNLRRNTLSLFFNWFVAGLCAFGFSQFISFIGRNEDIFVNFTVGGLVTIPGTLLCIYVVKRFGRRKTIILSGIVYGITCMLVGAVPAGRFPHEWPKIVFAGIALVSMSITFPALYLYSGELLPTVARNGGLGASSMFARFGSMIAPFILSLNIYGEYVPLLIMGILPVLAVLLLIPMPDTKGCSLPDTLEEGENFGRKERGANGDARSYMQITQQ
ncbi:UNVERIFIED_CONTAM: hypothetical protein PYX00_003792 [Menopon gallinae]|uniref:Major facilitator superfamily (MFS) profile domain-containing protein n=1 Tax=Menopon gallinae TaxID=328185 RepID=A0AAW2I1Y6_9NEOP